MIVRLGSVIWSEQVLFSISKPFVRIKIACGLIQGDFGVNIIDVIDVYVIVILAETIALCLIFLETLAVFVEVARLNGILVRLSDSASVFISL